MALFVAATGIMALLAGGALAVGRLRTVWGFGHARAVVVGAEPGWVERAGGRLVERRRVYFVRYRFRDAGGVAREFTDPAGTPVFPPDAEGLVLPVRYDPADPCRAVVWEFWPVWLGSLACLLGGLALLGAACWLR